MFYIKQMFQNDCGFAALKNLLANLYKNEDYLYIKQPENHGPFSYLQLVKESEKYGTELEGLEVDKENLLSWKEFPVIVTIKNAIGNPHAITLTKRINKKFYVLDPDLGEYWIKSDKLLNVWDGTMLRVKSSKEIKPNNVHKTIDLEKNQKILLYIFQILSALCLMFSILFLDSQKDFIFSLAFAGGFVLSEMIFRMMLWNMLKGLNRAIVEPLKVLPKEPLDFVFRLESYKKSIVTSGITTLFNGIIGIFLLVLTILNGSYNFIIALTVIILAILSTFIINPIYKKIGNDLECEEKSISRSKSCFEFKANYKKILDKSNKFALIKILKTILEIAIIYVSVMIAAYMNKQLNTMTVLFYVTIGYYLFVSICKMFGYKERNDELHLLKAKVVNLVQ